ncbi:MAG: hypothetical protein HKN07_14935 [Acidimicrobiia bacterium]|nr:hypothetical protein [Acidimicrobiia bacterium]
MAVRLPIPWDDFGFPSPVDLGGTILLDGEVAWEWESDTEPDAAAPAFEIDRCGPARAKDGPAGWSVDHVVLMVPSLDAAIETFASSHMRPRLRTSIDGRAMAFYRAHTVIEVIESPVRSAALYGIALTTDEPLEVVALRWRSLGHEVTDPKPAIQQGRRILTVRGLGSGLAIMSADRAR